MRALTLCGVPICASSQPFFISDIQCTLYGKPGSALLVNCIQHAFYLHNYQNVFRAVLCLQHSREKLAIVRPKLYAKEKLEERHCSGPTNNKKLRPVLLFLFLSLPWNNAFQQLKRSSILTRPFSQWHRTASANTDVWEQKLAHCTPQTCENNNAVRRPRKTNKQTNQKAHAVFVLSLFVCFLLQKFLTYWQNYWICSCKLTIHV